MLEGVHVLLVEDNARLSASLSAGLTEEGFTVETLDRGAAALEYLARHDRDVIILDLGLPDLDGTEVLARLRAAGSRVPVLVLTARDAIASLRMPLLQHRLQLLRAPSRSLLPQRNHFVGDRLRRLVRTPQRPTRSEVSTRYPVRTPDPLPAPRSPLPATADSRR
jgi:CheY-like chemotaxis protein